MMFSDGYFEGETREGFFVESKMKRAWAAEMEVLKEIDRICKKYEIQYFADSGTLLGAVRHKGFIPWDDDIDIAMKREDYEKFVAIAAGELPKRWILLNPFRTEDELWKQTFSRIVNMDRVCYEEEHLKQFHGCPYIVGVDIFPLDYLPQSEEEEEVLWLILKYLYAAICLLKEGKTEDFEPYLLEIEHICNVRIDRSGRVLNQLLRLADNVCKLYMNDQSDRLMYSMWGLDENKKYTYKKEWYRESVIVPFENMEIPIPVGYEEILKVLYGDNYMIPIREGARHDYPFYKRFDDRMEANNDEIGK